MKRIKITAVLISFLAIISMVGCISSPPGYYSGMHRGYSTSHITYDTGCGPCVPAASGCDVIEYTDNPCAPQSCAPASYATPYCVPRVADCRTTFSHLSNGVLLVGRGIIDIAAAPFVIVGNTLSSNCRYEVMTLCDSVSYTVPRYQVIEPCVPSHSMGCSSGCDTCSDGYTEGIQFGTSAQHHPAMLPAPTFRANSVVQASYQEPSAPVMRFVQPK